MTGDDSDAPLFARLARWLDTAPRPAAANMAADEIAADEAIRIGAPILRCYRWADPSLSFGYFERLADIEALPLAAGRTLVRRPTGGGAVPHSASGDDFTYALAIPRRDPAAALRPSALYARVHRAVAQALRLSGGAPDAAVLGDDPHLPAGPCFAKPVLGDVISAAGTKLAGAAQRRTRAGVLHQGSVQVRLRFEGFAALLAAQLAASSPEFQPPPEVEERISARAAARFAAADWMGRH